MDLPDMVSIGVHCTHMDPLYPLDPGQNPPWTPWYWGGPEFREFFSEIWVGPQDDENFAKFGWVAALSQAGLSFAKFSRFVGALIKRNFREI